MDKRKITLTVIAIAVLLVVLVGSTYAYWTLNGPAQTSANVQVQTGGLILRLDDVDGITSKDVIDPNHLSFSKYFSITNESAADGYAKVLFKGLTNTFVTDALVYELEEVQSDKTSFATPRMIITNEVLPKSASASNQTLADALLIEKGTLSGNTVTPNTKYYKLTVRYKYSDTVDQSEDLNQTLTSGFTMEEGQSSVTMSVSFITNGGLTTPSNISVTMGGTYGELPSIKKTRYILDGWYTDSSLTEKVESSSTVTKSTNHTLYAKWKETKLPNDYTQLEYLESTGSQYIDTKLNLSNGFHINGTIMVRKYIANTYIFGSHGSSSPYETNFFSMIDNVYTIGVAGTCYGGSIQVRENVKQTFDVSNITNNYWIKIDGNESSSYNLQVDYNSGYGNLNAYIFALNFGNSPGYYSKIRLYDTLSIYTSTDESSKVAEFIPAKCDKNEGCINSVGTTVVKGTPGMYDVVRNRFFTNLGSGVDFTPGEELW